MTIRPVYRSLVSITAFTLAVLCVINVAVYFFIVPARSDQELLVLSLVVSPLIAFVLGVLAYVLGRRCRFWIRALAVYSVIIAALCLEFVLLVSLPHNPSSRWRPSSATNLI